MANHPSAIKRARQGEKRRLKNKMNKTRIKNTVKATRAAAGESSEQAEKALNEAIRAINTAASKGTLHRKTASRKIARLSRYVFKTQSAERT